jgi:hypothetical protein
MSMMNIQALVLRFTANMLHVCTYAFLRKLSWLVIAWLRRSACHVETVPSGRSCPIISWAVTEPQTKHAYARSTFIYSIRLDSSNTMMPSVIYFQIEEDLVTYW